jgi:hypothetical protein
MPEKGAILAVLLVDRPLCLDCIAEKSRISRGNVEPLLGRIGTNIALTTTVDRCRACGRTVKVYWASRAE